MYIPVYNETSIRVTDALLVRFVEFTDHWKRYFLGEDGRPFAYPPLPAQHVLVVEISCDGVHELFVVYNVKDMQDLYADARARGLSVTWLHGYYNDVRARGEG